MSTDDYKPPADAATAMAPHAARPIPCRGVSANILDAIGDTPLLEIEGVFVKLEFLNPSGSIKARIAHYMIERAEQQGLLRPGDTIVEATSGIPAMPWRWLLRSKAIACWW